MKLRKINLEQSNTEIFTSHGGLTLLGQALELARLKAQFKSLGRYQGMSHDDILKTYLGLLCTGKSDFEAAEGARTDPFFHAALGIKQVPSAPRLRQRMDERALEYARAVDEASIVLLERIQAQVSPVWTGHVPLDMVSQPFTSGLFCWRACLKPTRWTARVPGRNAPGGVRHRGGNHTAGSDSHWRAEQGAGAKTGAGGLGTSHNRFRIEIRSGRFRLGRCSAKAPG